MTPPHLLHCVHVNKAHLAIGNTEIMAALHLLLIIVLLVTQSTRGEAQQSNALGDEDGDEDGWRPLEEEMGELKVALLERLEALSVKLEWALGAGTPPLNSSRFLQLMGDMKGRLVSLEDSVANGRCEPVIVRPECPPQSCPRCPSCVCHPNKCPPRPVCPPRIPCPPRPACPACSISRRRRFFRRIG